MHKTSRELGGDWITVKQSNTFELPEYQTTWDNTYAIVKNLFIERNTLVVYKIKATLSILSDVRIIIKIYNNIAISYDLTPSNNKINTTFIMLDNVFYLSESASINYPSDGNLYIRTTETKGYTIDVNSEVTVKYLNFDS